MRRAHFSTFVENLCSEKSLFDGLAAVDTSSRKFDNVGTGSQKGCGRCASVGCLDEERACLDLICFD
jgi:hypothetical protein